MGLSCHLQMTVASFKLHPLPVFSSAPPGKPVAGSHPSHRGSHPIYHPFLGCACAHGRSRGSHGAVPALPVPSIRAGAWSRCSALIPSSPGFAGEGGGKKKTPTLNSSLLTAKGNCSVGFWAEGAQNSEAALSLSREAALDESWRGVGGGNYL